MSFSQSAAMHVVPLLARIVLAAAFIPAGWNKVMTEFEPSPTQEAALVRLGVLPGRTTGADVTIRRAHFLQDTPAETPDAAAAPEGIPADPPATAPVVTESEVKPVVPPPTKPAVVKVRKVHFVTLMLDQNGLSQYAVLGGWVAALTELVGGALLLVGLFSRIWGLGLSILMGVAFWLAGWPTVQETWIFAATPDEGHMIFCQLGLFVLAFGVLLTGPGKLSLDGAIFRASPPPPSPNSRPGPDLKPI